MTHPKPPSDSLDPAPFLWAEGEYSAAVPLVEQALEEDLGAVGDLTSQAVIPADLQGRALFVTREAGIVSGLPLVQIVFGQLSQHVEIEWLQQDGAAVEKDDKLALISGPMRSLLTGERTALNFLQRLSGIATRTRTFVDAVSGTSAVILDTRKTIPGWRILEKYAVRCGGGHNHRLGLFDGILIKDNHLECLGNGPGVITQAVAQAREKVGLSVPVEIEIDRLDQLAEALSCQPDIVLLDNMSCADMSEAVRRRDGSAPGILLEASGGITLERVAEIAATGVDRISVGGLTHSARALDIGLDYEAP